MIFSIKNLSKLVLIVIFFVITSCGINNNLIQDGDVYLYQGKEQIIVSFITKPSKDTLQLTAKMISFLRTKQDNKLQQNSILIEGLTEDSFYNFHKIADTLFFVKDLYKNKTLIYAYTASLYQIFAQKEKLSTFIPLSQFQSLILNEKISLKECTLLIDSVVDFAVTNMFYVSILELLERPQRYFYPQKTQEELYRVLIYPEILGFWKYLQFRYGNSVLLKLAQTNYTPEHIHITLGEEIHKLEAAYTQQIEQAKTKSKILSNEEFYSKLTNTTYLYMSGTKKSLLRE